jgi:hypothetical protein
MGAGHGVEKETRNAQNDIEESDISEGCEGDMGYGNVMWTEPGSGSWPVTSCGITDIESPGTILFTLQSAIP